MAVAFDHERLKLDAAAKGWDGETLAAASGVSAMTISRFFRGQPISPRTAKKLADAIGKSLKRYTPDPARETVTHG